LRAFDAARTGVEELRKRLEDRRADLEKVSEIGAGRPVLELAFIGRR
jgi:hypothetical protein